MAPAPLGPPPSIDLTSILSAVAYTTNGIAAHDTAIQTIWSKQVADEASIATLQAQGPTPGPQGPQGVPGTPTNMLGVLVYPAALTYGPQAVNTSSPAQFILVANQTNGIITLSPSASVGPFYAAGLGNCGVTTTLAPGQNCTYSLLFHPGSTGTKTGTFTVTIGAITNTINLMGSGQ